MGLSDIIKLIEINNYIIKQYPKFRFSIDRGNFETRLCIDELGYYFVPEEKQNFKDLYLGSERVLLVPDLLDLKNKLIIEYNEESKPHRGHKIIKKGHFEESKRDTNKNHYYNILIIKHGFRYLQIWETDPEWKNKINAFLDKS